MQKSNEIVLNGAQIIVRAHVALNIGTQSAELFFESTVDQKKIPSWWALQNFVSSFEFPSVVFCFRFGVFSEK